MKKFKGFPPEGQYWQFPTIINGYIDQLTGAEFKVLWYILRHTYGFQKDYDSISLSQFEKGIKNADAGTGLTKPTIIGALRTLKKKGFILIIKPSFSQTTRGYITSYKPNIGGKKGEISLNEYILKLYNRKCFYCNKYLTSKNLHIDHYIPRSKYGSSNISNLVASCPKCNTKKGNKTGLEFGGKEIKPLPSKIIKPPRGKKFLPTIYNNTIYNKQYKESLNKYPTLSEIKKKAFRYSNQKKG